ncbi:thiamine pyrophosphokinase [Obelidium mucronatum]|nr:thiamine pyrophosphokinase [Obelidium mucronatum]
MSSVWNASLYLQPTNSSPPPPHALIILNQPICARKYLRNLWTSAAIKICADGGANRLFDAFANDEDRLEFLPDLIRGDLDSVRPDVSDWYSSHGVVISKSDCQYSTDFGKCVAHIESVEAKTGIVHEIIAMGALGGRFDQTLSSVFMLYQMQKKDKEEGKEIRKVYLVSNESIALLLNPESKHHIVCNMDLEGPTCGLIPMSGRALVETQGLKWNLDHSIPMSFHELISTSNWFADGDERVKSVEVVTDAPLVWTVEVNLSA